jgi:hypothetical protein
MGIFGKRLKKEQQQILDNLKQYLIENPNQRVGQAVTNLTENKEIGLHLYHLSDYEFLRLMKENTKKLWTILFILVSGVCLGQSDTLTHRGELKIVTSIPYAKNQEYWGQKGLLSQPLISGYETRIQILEAKVGFHEMINRNCNKAQEEYRLMVQNAAGVNAKLEKELTEIISERDKWQHRAKNRGQMLSFGAVIVGLLAYIQISN